MWCSRSWLLKTFLHMRTPHCESIHLGSLGRSHNCVMRVRKYGVNLAEAVQEEKPRVKNVANEVLVKTGGGGRRSELHKLAAAAM